MHDSYIDFIYSDEILDWIDWARAIRNHDLNQFIELYDSLDEASETLFDPIELAIAYDSENIFDYLIEHYDYTNFTNTLDMTLLEIILVFSREQFLISALDRFTFSDEHLFRMYEYIITYKDSDDFKQLHSRYGVSEGYTKWLFLKALEDRDALEYLISIHGDEWLFDYDVVYDLVTAHPQLLDLIEDIASLDDYMDTDFFSKIVKLEKLDDIVNVITFLLDHGWDLNTHNRFGLTSMHMALRHAQSADVIYALKDLGGDLNVPTSLGYKAAHQLLLREAEFTLDLSEIIDFKAKDGFGLSLQDYDEMQREKELKMENVISIVRVVTNMEESTLYELNEDEFYNLMFMSGIGIFFPYLTMITTASKQISNVLMHELTTLGIDVGDIRAFKDMFGDDFKQEVQTTLALGMEFHQISDSLLETLADFAKYHDTSIAIESESNQVNRMGEITIAIDKDGVIRKHAIINTTLLDVFYITHYYGVPMENVEYAPVFNKSQRFLN
ncbi:MAG: hypothetical protein ACQEQA_02545 [Bacillota bacterium]